MKKTILLAVALIGIIALASVFYNNYQTNDPSQLKPSGIYSDLQKDENQDSVSDNSSKTETNPNDDTIDNTNTSGNTDGMEDSATNTDNSAADTDNSNTIPAMDFTVYDETGNAINLSDFYSKPIIVNFWATWCGPCKSELPAFEQLYSEYGETISFLMVNLTDGAQETVDSVREFVTDNDYSFPVYFDTELDAAMTYSVYSIPATLFIDADGNIAASHMGPMSESTLRTYIEQLISTE